MGIKKLYRKPKPIKVPRLSLNGNTFAKKSKRNGTVNNIKAYVKYYLNTSTIHGIKYIGEAGRHFVEKFLWLFVMVTLCSICLFLITKTYMKWQKSPVIVSLETRETPIYEIPFPAITVCSEIKMDPEDFNITDYVLKRRKGVYTNEREHNLFQASLLLCKEALYSLSDVHDKKNFIDSEFLNEALTYAPFPIFQHLTSAQFLGKIVTEGISASLTEQGLCLSFNMLPTEDIIYHVQDFMKHMSNSEIKVKNWSLDDGYPPEDSLDSYPRRTFLSGVDGGLEVHALYINHSKIDSLCEEGVHGFKVALHHPCELPNMDKHFRLPLNQAVIVAIKPTMIKVSKELINYKPEERRCYFSKEKPLAFYKIYTQQNCLVECLTNYTLEQCDCIPFWLQFKKDFKICGPKKVGCIKGCKVDYLRRKSESDECDCLPLCTSLSYDIETSYTSWNWRELFKIYSAVNTSPFNSDSEMAHFSKISVYYKEMQFLTSKRRQIYGIIDFFSNIGGLLGLFIGFSVISAVELIYFLTLRIICNIHKYGRDYWYGEP